MDDLVKEFMALSPGGKGAVVVVAGSITYLIANFILAILRLIFKPIAYVFRSIKGKSVAQTPEPSTISTPTSKPPPPPPGISMKQLMKSAHKAASSKTGPDRHKDSELFIATLRGHSDAVTGLAFSSNGRAFATACEDRTVRVFDLSSLASGKNIPFSHVEVRKGCLDVAFGDDANHVAVLTQGVLAEGSGLCLLDTSTRSQNWEKTSIFPQKLIGNCLQGSHGSSSGPGVLVASTEKPVLKVFSTTGTELGSIDTGGMITHNIAISKDGRFIAAATFTSDVKVYEVVFDRLGIFQGIQKVMDLKGHKSKVKCVAFSPDCSKAVTASEDGTIKIYNIQVRYHMDEDPKIILSAGLPLPKGSCYSRIAWGPDNYLAAVHGSTIHILDTRLELVDTIKDAHSSTITDIAWAPSRLEGPQGKSSILATAGVDHRVRLWRGPWPLV